MTKPILSICIATLNRAAFIGQTLDSIISQATEHVEIVIVDGASTDSTQEVVQEYQRRFPRLRYLRLAAKGGVDRDYARTVEQAQGDYCWLMSDDDLIKPGAIQAVLDVARQGHGLIVVNYEVRTADLSKLLIPKLIPVEADRVYRADEYQGVFHDLAPYLSFIGCVVIRRELWNAREKEEYFGTEFLHVGVIFQKPIPESCLVLAHPWVVIRYGNALWTARSFEIWMFKWPGLIWSFGDYDEQAKRTVTLREPWRQMKLLYVQRTQGGYSLREYRHWLASRFDSWRDRVVARAIAQMPGVLANSILLAYLSLVRPWAGVPLVDLKNSRFYCRNYFRRWFRANS